MQKRLIITEDGSHSISIPELNVIYHSIHGAIQESKHVFIEAGLKYLLDRFENEQICILEVSFGTGLNVLLTAIKVERSETSIYYVALEPFPISTEEIHSLNYCELLGRKDLQEDFRRMHKCEWNKSIVFRKRFNP